MANKKTLVVISGGATENARLTRREMVQRLLAGAGAGAAWPLVASSHPIYALLTSDAILDEADNLGDANWKPAFLSAQQNESLTALDKPENQHKFVESLTALNAEAHKRFGKDFPALDEEQKNALLTDASTKPESAKAPETENGKKQSGLYSHFENLKGWISGAYYSSEVGMRELGWRGDYAFAAFPGCAHPEGHN